MALTRQVGSVTAATTNGGTSTITLPSGFDPKFLGLRTVCMTADGVSGTTLAHGRYAEGFCTNDGGSLQQAGLSFYATDDAATTAIFRGYSETQALYICNGTTTVDAIASVTTWSDTSIVLTWSDAAPAAWIVEYEALGGSDIEARAFTAALTLTATQDFTVAAGWGQPTMVMCAIHNRTGGGSVVQGNLAHGRGIALSATSRSVSCFADQNGGLTVTAGSVQSDKFLAALSTASALVAEGDLTTPNPVTDGFRITYSVTPTAAIKPIFIAFKGSFAATIGRSTTNANPRSLTHSTVPTFGMWWSTGVVANAGVDTSSAQLGGWITGSFDGTNEGTLGVNDKDAATEGANATWMSRSKSLTIYTPPATTTTAAVKRYEADAAVSGNNINLTPSTADSVATEFTWVLLSGSAAADVTLTPGAATATAAGSTPSIVVDAALAPAAANATATGSTPTLAIDQVLTPGQAAASASGSTPSLVVDAALSPGPANADATGSTALVSAGGDVTLAPNAANADATGSTATVGTDSALTPGQATATASGSTPGLSVDAVRAPGPAVATASGSTAGVTTAAVVDVTVTPGTASATATGSTATIVITPDPVIPPAPGGGGGDVDFGDETSIYGASVRLEPGPAVAWASGSFAEVVVVNAPRPVRIILPKRRQRQRQRRVVPKSVPVVRNQRIHAGTARAVASGSAARVEALSVLSQAEIEDLRGESEEDAVALLMLTS